MAGREEEREHKCCVCGENFLSKNKLFKHLKSGGECSKVSGHAPQAHQCPEEPNAEQLDRTYVYVIGGRERGHTLGFVERFSPSRQVWEKCPHMIEQRGSHGAASLAGRLYAFSGGGIESNLGTCECMDPCTHNWHYVAGMATKRHALAAVSSCDAIYAVGGWEDGRRCSGVVEVYDAAADVWRTRAPMLLPRRLHGLALLGGHIYAFGGASDEQVDIKEAERLCLESDKWESICPLPAAACTSAAAVGGYVYVMLWGKSVYRFDPTSSGGGGYSKVCPLPLPEWYGFAVAAVGADIYMFGGATKGRWSARAFRFDTRTHTFHDLPSMSAVRRRCAASALVLPPDTPAPPSDTLGALSRLECPEEETRQEP